MRRPLGLRAYGSTTTPAPPCPRLYAAGDLACVPHNYMIGAFVFGDLAGADAARYTAYEGELPRRPAARGARADLPPAAQPGRAAAAPGRVQAAPLRQRLRGPAEDRRPAVAGPGGVRADARRHRRDGRPHPARADALRRGHLHPRLRRDGRALLAGPHGVPLGPLPRAPRPPASATTPPGCTTSTCASRRPVRWSSRPVRWRRTWCRSTASPRSAARPVTSARCTPSRWRRRGRGRWRRSPIGARARDERRRPSATARAAVPPARARPPRASSNCSPSPRRSPNSPPSRPYLADPDPAVRRDRRHRPHRDRSRRAPGRRSPRRSPTPTPGVRAAAAALAARTRRDPAARTRPARRPRRRPGRSPTRVVRAAALDVLRALRLGDAACSRGSLTDPDIAVRIEAVRALVSVDAAAELARAAPPTRPARSGSRSPRPWAPPSSAQLGDTAPTGPEPAYDPSALSG